MVGRHDDGHLGEGLPHPGDGLGDGVLRRARGGDEQGRGRPLPLGPQRRGCARGVTRERGEAVEVGLVAEALVDGPQPALALGGQCSRVRAQTVDDPGDVLRGPVDARVAEDLLHLRRDDADGAGGQSLQHDAAEGLDEPGVVEVDEEVDAGQEPRHGDGAEGQGRPGLRQAAQDLLGRLRPAQHAHPVARVVRVGGQQVLAGVRPLRPVPAAVPPDDGGLPHEAVAGRRPDGRVDDVDPVLVHHRHVPPRPGDRGPHQRPDRRPDGCVSQRPLRVPMHGLHVVVGLRRPVVDRHLVGDHDGRGDPDPRQVLRDGAEEGGVAHQQGAGAHGLVRQDQLRFPRRHDVLDALRERPPAALHRRGQVQERGAVAGAVLGLDLLDDAGGRPAGEAAVGRHDDVEVVRAPLIPVAHRVLILS